MKREIQKISQETEPNENPGFDLLLFHFNSNFLFDFKWRVIRAIAVLPGDQGTRSLCSSCVGRNREKREHSVTNSRAGVPTVP